RLFFPVIEDQKLGRRQSDSFSAIQVAVPGQGREQVGYIKEKAQGQIAAAGGLVLIQGQAVPGQEGNIVVNRHINGIFQRVDFQQSGILIIGSIHCIIQRKQLFFVAEQHSENTVFECTSGRQ